MIDINGKPVDIGSLVVTYDFKEEREVVWVNDIADTITTIDENDSKHESPRGISRYGRIAVVGRAR